MALYSEDAVSLGNRQEIDKDNIQEEIDMLFDSLVMERFNIRAYKLK